MPITLSRGLIVRTDETAHCERHGPYPVVMIRNRRLGCPTCRSEAISAESLRKKSASDPEAMAARLRATGIPKRYWQKRLDDFIATTDGQKAALSLAKRYVEAWPTEVYPNGRSLCLLGRPGTGKTHLAIAIAVEVIERHRCSLRYLSLIDMIEAIKDSWSARSSLSPTAIIEGFAAVDLLIVDEASQRHGTENERLQFFRLINKRYERLLPTILIANSNIGQTAAMLGEASWDRLKEGGGQAILFDWESHRGKRS